MIKYICIEKILTSIYVISILSFTSTIKKTLLNSRAIHLTEIFLSSFFNILSENNRCYKIMD
jgi:hypothetical protein